jgi:hypothetical protein
MKKLDKFFMTTMAAGLITFSAALAIPAQISIAAIGTSWIITR